jgi:hypothetical protein
MGFVRNLPLPSYHCEQALGAQARDAIDHCHPFRTRVWEHDVTSQLKDLREPGPIAVADEGRTHRALVLLDAPMAQVDCARRGVAVVNGRARQDQRAIGPQLWLVLFDDHDISPSFFDKRLRHVALGQERVHGANTTVEAQALSDRLDGGDRMGCGVHGMVGERHAHMVDQRC